MGYTVNLPRYSNLYLISFIIYEELSEDKLYLYRLRSRLTQFKLNLSDRHVLGVL